MYQQKIAFAFLKCCNNLQVKLSKLAKKKLVSKWSNQKSMQPSILHSVTQVRSKISYLFLRFIFHDVASTLGLKSQEIGCSSSAFTTFSSHTDDHPFPLLSCVQWGRVTLVVIPVLENWRSRVATAALLDPPPPSCVEQLDSCPPHCLQLAHRAFFYFGGTRQATASTRPLLLTSLARLLRQSWRQRPYALW